MFNKIASAADGLKQAGLDALDSLGIVKKGPSGDEPTDNSIEEIFWQSFSKSDVKMWRVNAQSWYKIMAYRFSVVDNSDLSKKMHFTLPIPPENYTIRPVMPNAVTPTFGGVHEDSSAIKLWSIQMSGTMGTGVGRDSNDQREKKLAAQEFREIMTTTGMLSGAFTELNKTAAKVGGVIDRVVTGVDAVRNAGNAADAVAAGMGAVTGALNDALLPALPYAGSAVSDKSNGFSELEEFQRFLYMYQALKAKHPDRFSLYFADYKTDKVWRISVSDFAIQKNAQTPLQTRFTLSGTGWGVQSINSFYTDQDKLQGEFDRFSQNGDLKSVNVTTNALIVNTLGNMFK